MSWNYRVIKQTYRYDGGEDVIFGIHEVYYNNDGSPRVYTDDAVSVAGDDIDGLRWALGKMLEALDKVVLTPEDFDFEKDEKVSDR